MRSVVVAGGPDGDGKARRGCLAAPRAAASAFLNFNPVERGPSRAIYPDAFFDGRRLAASGAVDKAGTLKVQPPISFLGLGRALQPRNQSRSGLAQTFHVFPSWRLSWKLRRANRKRKGGRNERD